MNTKEEKEAFVKQYKEKENIDLSDHSRFVKNPGKRAVAKLMLNSLVKNIVEKYHNLIVFSGESLPKTWIEKRPPLFLTRASSGDLFMTLIQ